GASTMVVARPTASPSPIALTAGPRGAEIRAPEGTRALAVAVSPEQATRLIDATRSGTELDIGARGAVNRRRRSARAAQAVPASQCPRP
ncbi:MAG: hypothetical protein IT378_02745, partial [Sandaracinaceae bacterium]|nr:hypothetical protein [Sandaracinaceae bacterium]